MQLAMMEERGISARTDCGRLHVFGLPMRSAVRLKSWPCLDIPHSPKCKSISRKPIGNGWQHRRWIRSAGSKRKQSLQTFGPSFANRELRA